MITHLKKSGLIAGMCLCLLTAPAVVPGQLQIPDKAAGGAETVESMAAKLEFAHVQHEIILLHIQDGEFDNVWPAAKHLLALRFPPEQEEYVVRSLAIITEKLIKQDRFDLAHQILDTAGRTLSDNKNKSKVHIIQGRIYKLEGQIQKAIESFRKSQELNPQPE